MTSGPRYRRKKDGNQNELFSLAERVNGLEMLDVSMHPGLGFDAVGRYQGGPAHMLEIKRSKSKTLTDSEKEARRYYGEYWHRVETFDDLLRVFGISTEAAPENW